MFGAISVFSAAGAYTVKYLHHRGWRAAAVMVVGGTIALSSMAIGLQLTTAAIVLSLSTAFATGFVRPTQRLIVNENTPPRIRASALSASTTITGAGSLIGFTVSGLIADHGSPRMAGAAALALALAGLVVLWPLRKRPLPRRAQP
jgi:MFS family permease